MADFHLSSTPGAKVVVEYAANNLRVTGIGVRGTTSKRLYITLDRLVQGVPVRAVTLSDIAVTGDATLVNLRPLSLNMRENVDDDGENIELALPEGFMSERFVEWRD